MVIVVLYTEFSGHLMKLLQNILFKVSSNKCPEQNSLILIQTIKNKTKGKGWKIVLHSKRVMRHINADYVHGHYKSLTTTVLRISSENGVCQFRKNYQRETKIIVRTCSLLFYIGNHWHLHDQDRLLAHFFQNATESRPANVNQIQLIFIKRFLLIIYKG